MQLRALAILAALAGPAVALPALAAAAPVTVGHSSALSVDVVASGPDWCSPAPEFDVVGPGAATFGTVELGDLVKRLGTQVVAVQCPQAQKIRLHGLVRGGAVSPVWLATADAANGWATHPEAPAPVNLDAPGGAPALPLAQPAASSVSPVPAVPAPAVPAVTDSRPVPLGAAGRAKAEAALGNLPGRWNPARRCWTASVRSPGMVETACLSIVKGFIVPADPGAEVHLLLEGRGGTDCHACAGLAAFAVVAANGEVWRAVARPLVVGSGSYGQPNDPKQIAFARLGAARWGWIENNDGFGQGALEGTVLVHLMRDGVATSVGELPGDQGNTGACDTFGQGRPGCERKVDYTVTATPDLSAPDLAAYPIVLHARGTLGGPLDKQLRVPFDQRTGQYTAPATWP